MTSLLLALSLAIGVLVPGAVAEPTAHEPSRVPACLTSWSFPTDAAKAGADQGDRVEPRPRRLESAPAAPPSK